MSENSRDRKINIPKGPILSGILATSIGLFAQSAEAHSGKPFDRQTRPGIVQPFGGALMSPDIKMNELSLFSEPRIVAGPQTWVVNYCTPQGETPSAHPGIEKQMIEERMIPYFVTASGGRIGPIKVEYSNSARIPALSTFKDNHGSLDLFKVGRACEDATDSSINYTNGTTIIIDMIDSDKTEVGPAGGGDYLKRDGMKDTKVAGRVWLSKPSEKEGKRVGFWDEAVFGEEFAHASPFVIGHTRVRTGTDTKGKPIYEEHSDPWNVNGGWLTNFTLAPYGYILPRLAAPYLLDLGWSSESDHLVVEPGNFLEQRIKYLDFDESEGEKIPRIIVVEFSPKAGVTEEYIIQARRRILDKKVPDPVPARGAVVYKSDKSNFPYQPYELITTPAGDAYVPWTKNSGSLRDETNKIRIEVDEIDNSGLTVRVWNNTANALSTEVPTATATATATATPTIIKGITTYTVDLPLVENTKLK